MAATPMPGSGLRGPGRNIKAPAVPRNAKVNNPSRVAVENRRFKGAADMVHL